MYKLLVYRKSLQNIITWGHIHFAKNTNNSDTYRLFRTDTITCHLTRHYLLVQVLTLIQEADISAVK